MQDMKANVEPVKAVKRKAQAVYTMPFTVEALSKEFFVPDGLNGWRERRQWSLTSENISPQLPRYHGFRKFSSPLFYRSVHHVSANARRS